jgi:hypothetical protein
MKLLIELSVADLRYFLRRLGSTREFLIHKLDVNFLSEFEGETLARTLQRTALGRQFRGLKDGSHKQRW